MAYALELCVVFLSWKKPFLCGTVIQLAKGWNILHHRNGSNLICWHTQYVTSGTGCATHNYCSLKCFTVRFRLSCPLWQLATSRSLPTAFAGVQFRKAQQVYQNLCCLSVALSFQKPDLVPDLILPGGLHQAPSCLNIWWTSAAFGCLF